MPPMSALAMLPPPRKVIFMRSFFHQKCYSVSTPVFPRISGERGDCD
jgi:hypothetical protein